MLEMRKKHGFTPKYINVQAPTATMNKTPALKVPLQTEPRFHLRRYEQPHTIGGPAEQQKADGRCPLQQQRQRPLLRVVELDRKSVV